MQNGQSIISGWSDGKIRAFGPQSGKLLYTIHDAHQGAVTAISGTPDSTRIISGGEEGMVRMWAIHAQSQVMEASMKVCCASLAWGMLYPRIDYGTCHVDHAVLPSHQISKLALTMLCYGTPCWTWDTSKVTAKNCRRLVVGYCWRQVPCFQCKPCPMHVSVQTERHRSSSLCRCFCLTILVQT